MEGHFKAFELDRAEGENEISVRTGKNSSESGKDDEAKAFRLTIAKNDFC